MRRIVLLVIFSTALTLYGGEIKMADGEVVTFSSIMRSEPDGIVVMTDSGVPKIRFSKMSKEEQRQYGYNPTNARVYETQKVQAEADRYHQILASQRNSANAVSAENNSVNTVASNKPTQINTNNIQCNLKECFDFSRVYNEPITENLGVVGNRSFAKPTTTLGESIYIDIPYWPTAKAIWDEVIKSQKQTAERVWQEHANNLRLWQEQAENWEGGAIATCTSMVLELYGVRVSPREIIQNASGYSYDPHRRFINPWEDFWYDGIVQIVQKRGYQWVFKTLRKEPSQFQNDFKTIKDSLDKGNPIITSVSIPQSDKWHSVVIHGYDEKTNVIYITDPTIMRPGLRIISYKNFESIWHSLDGTDMRYILFTSLRK